MNLQRTADRYLADTSVWIRVLRRDGPAPLKTRVAEIARLGQLGLSDMVRLEIRVGVRSDREWEETEHSLGAAVLLPTRRADWETAARMGSNLRRAGLNLGAADLLIAAVAMNNDVSLLHVDRDFERIAAHTALRTAPAFDLLA